MKTEHVHLFEIAFQLFLLACNLNCYYFEVSECYDSVGQTFGVCTNSVVENK